MSYDFITQIDLDRICVVSSMRQAKIATLVSDWVELGMISNALQNLDWILIFYHYLVNSNSLDLDNG